MLVVLYFNGMGNPAEAENDTPASSWVWNAERLAGRPRPRRRPLTVVPATWRERGSLGQSASGRS